MKEFVKNDNKRSVQALNPQVYRSLFTHIRNSEYSIFIPRLILKQAKEVFSIAVLFCGTARL